MEDCKYKLSVIIPMYNAEKYIGECLDSILESDLPKGRYEILVVNDGSKDNGPAVAMEYAAKHDNITYLTQENQGQSVARNYGIRECHGEYVWFVDSDDKVTKEINHALSYIEQQSLDILAFKMKVYNKDGSFGLSPNKWDLVECGKLVNPKELIEKDFILGTICRYFIRKQLLLDHALFFKPGITHQDVELSYRLYSYAEKLMFIDDVLYVYVYHSDSVSRSVSPQKKIKYLKDSIYVMESKKILADEFKEISPTYAKKLDILADISLFGLVYELFVNRKTWGRNGISEPVLEELKAKKLYPLRGTFHSVKKNIFKLILNQEWLLKG